VSAVTCVQDGCRKLRRRRSLRVEMTEWVVTGLIELCGLPISQSAMLSPSLLELETVPELAPELIHDDSPATPAGPEEQDGILLGESLAVRRLRSQVRRIAPYFHIAVLSGEAGCGKELVARAIHARSAGPDAPFVVAAPHKAAALVDSSVTGTLYLDRVEDFTSAQQAELARALRMCVERRTLGSLRRPATGAPGTVRILAATERDLRTLWSVGKFRQDLYARLSAVEIQVPPLRQRTEDIDPLSAWLLERIGEQAGQVRRLSPEAVMQLQRMTWHHNFGQLQSVLGQAAAIADGPTIEPRHLIAVVETVRASEAASAHRSDRLQDVLERHVLDVLTRCGGNKLRAAQTLGISRSTLYRMLDSCGALGVEE